jgi:hypothetical protein
LAVATARNGACIGVQQFSHAHRRAACKRPTLLVMTALILQRSSVSVSAGKWFAVPQKAQSNGFGFAETFHPSPWWSAIVITAASWQLNGRERRSHPGPAQHGGICRNCRETRVDLCYNVSNGFQSLLFPATMQTGAPRPSQINFLHRQYEFTYQSRSLLHQKDSILLNIRR